MQASQPKKFHSFIMYTKPNCPFCDKAKELLTSTNETVIYHDITKEEGHKDYIIWFLEARDLPKTVPQVFVKEHEDSTAHPLQYVGGYDKLSEFMTKHNA